MSRRAGQLLWNRIRFSAGDGTGVLTFDIDTGIRQTLRGENVNSVNEPRFDTGPNPSVLPSRLQVIPQSPLLPWVSGALLTHGEPFLDPTTDTLHVIFTRAVDAAFEVNVLFWDPHSGIGPGDADTYADHS